MKILNLTVEFSEEERNILARFFKENEEFIFNNSFIYYENIKVFGDIYEKFLNENKLKDNEKLMLFLLEIRYDQIAYKITDNTNHRKVEKMYIPKNRLNDTIAKWYHESQIGLYVSTGTLKEENKLKKRLVQNERERRRGEEIASNYIVR